MAVAYYPAVGEGLCADRRVSLASYTGTLLASRNERDLNVTNRVQLTLDGTVHGGWHALLGVFYSQTQYAQALPQNSNRVSGTEARVQVGHDCWQRSVATALGSGRLSEPCAGCSHGQRQRVSRQPYRAAPGLERQRNIRGPGTDRLNSRAPRKLCGAQLVRPRGRYHLRLKCDGQIAHRSYGPARASFNSGKPHKRLLLVNPKTLMLTNAKPCVLLRGWRWHHRPT